MIRFTNENQAILLREIVKKKLPHKAKDSGRSSCSLHFGSPSRFGPWTGCVLRLILALLITESPSSSCYFRNETERERSHNIHSTCQVASHRQKNTRNDNDGTFANIHFSFCSPTSYLPPTWVLFGRNRTRLGVLERESVCVWGRDVMM